MEDLTPELLVKIFSYVVESEGCVRFLRNVAPVCKRWRELSSTPSLWKTVKEKRWTDLLNLSQRGYLYHTQILRVPLQFSSPVELSEVIPNIRKLKALSMSYGTVDGDMITLIAQHCQDLEHFGMTYVRFGTFDSFQSLSLEDLLPVLNACGPKLKFLDLSLNYISEIDKLIEGIVEKCPSLEVFNFNNFIETSSIENPFPVHKILNGCSTLMELEFSGVQVASSSMKNCTGFKNLKVFTAFENNFHGMDVYNLLKDSSNLEYLELESNDNLILDNISKIPSNKLKTLIIVSKNSDKELKFFEQAVEKWKHTLLELNLWGWECGITSVIQILLESNPNLKLDSLTIEVGATNHPIFRTFIEKCKTLSRVNVSSSLPYGSTEFKNRQEVETMLDCLQREATAD